MGRFELLLEDNPVYSLSGVWEDTRIDYEDDFLGYWGVTDDEPPEFIDYDDWERFRERYWLSQKLVNGAKGLVRPRRLPERDLSLLDELREEAEGRQEEMDELKEEVREVLGTDAWHQVWEATRPTHPSDPRTEHRFFRNCLEIEATKLWGVDPRQMAKRMRDLLRYLLDEPGDRVRAYLSRVAECYVRNMDTEFAVMSRAVLEAALTDAMSDEKVRKETGAEGQPGLGARIDAAMSTDLLDAETGEAAFRVQRAGNTAVHGSPDLEPDLEELLDDMVRVVQMVES